MRPCQHCGAAMAFNSPVCAECGGEQRDTVGPSSTQSQPGVACEPHASVSQQTAPQSGETELGGVSWLLRAIVIVVVTFNAGVIALAYALDGAAAIHTAMLTVAVVMGSDALVVMLGGGEVFAILALIGFAVFRASLFEAAMLVAAIAMVAPVLFMAFDHHGRATLFLIALAALNGAGAYFSGALL